MAKTNTTYTTFAAKKLLGKAQTRPTRTDLQEVYPSNVSVPGGGVFAESLPREPGTDMYTLYSASAGAPVTVERVYFDVVAINDSEYDANDSNEGGDEAQSSGKHAYYLKLPSTYETTSSNPLTGSGNFVNGKRLYESRGGLQLIPPFTTDAGLPGAGGNNRYYVKLYTGDPANEANKISEASAVDWQFDYYSGIIFIQDYDASKIPVTASAYLYVGKYLDDKLTDLATESDTITVKDEGSTITTSATSLDFVGSGVNITNNAGAVTVNVSAIAYQRTPVTTTMTASIADKILGVSASANLDIRLPAASGFSNGQYFTIKDEAGNANTNTITIKTTGGDTIDGQTSIVLESPHAALNVYSDGSNKFFIY
jgi:hypothetical protein|tara:strand:- start:724 stop:1830 length:1107 start_codon:yes stop_codon:yes gene_type:complete